MPIISCKSIENKNYRLCVDNGFNVRENVVVTSDGIYSIHYIHNGKTINRIGKVINIIQNEALPNNNYILFDYSEDNSNRQERIYFNKIRAFRDITPNDGYHIAVKHGFKGTEEEWLESLNGKTAYELAVSNGFEGTEEEWLESLKGESAYEIAVSLGFNGSIEEWVQSLQPIHGKSAYQIAVEHGFNGTEADWMAKNGDVTALKEELDRIVNILRFKVL